MGLGCHTPSGWTSRTTVGGQLLKRLFTTVLDGKAKLYDHTNKELVFFKERIESTAHEPPKPTEESL